MAAPYPSIDSGFIYDPRKKLDCLMSDFFEAEYSQSHLFKDSVTSFPWLIQQYQKDPDELVSQMRLRLKTYLMRYFDEMELELAVESDNSMTGYGIRMYLMVKQDGSEAITLYNRLKIEDDKFERSIVIRE